MSTGEPMGEVMRSRYNEIMLDAGGRLDFGLCQPGAPILAENPMRGGGANRTLYGDPLFKPFPKSGRACLRTRASPLPGGAGLRVTCEVADESAPVFWDMFGDDRDNPERIHAVVEVPARPGEIKEVSAVATSPEGKKVTVSACHWAVEKIEGKSFVHLQVNATRNSLAKKGVRVEFTVMNREPAR
jgi:hypothetical protein